jgi:membrane-associated phospholipid phosphatase
MRASECVQIGLSIGFALLAWVRPLDARRRFRIALLAIGVVAAILAARFALHGYLSSIVRDWLPAVLLLFPYWQAGEFFTVANRRIEERLGRIDERVMRWLDGTRLRGEKKGWATYFESAYLMCYPLVPVGLGVLYLAHHRAAADFYWVVVVLASDICFAITVFVPAMPPRLLPEGSMPQSSESGDVRKLNLEVLNRGSIQAITFPSAHVASTTAAALVLVWFVPQAGAVFLAIALSIAIGAFLGRYHYFLDVILGAIEALIVFLACSIVIRP